MSFFYNKLYYVINIFNKNSNLIVSKANCKKNNSIFIIIKINNKGNKKFNLIFPLIILT